MEKFFQIDWSKLFAPTDSLLEIVIRGSIMYLAMFALLRIFRRQAGSVGIADLLVIVVIADAAQNGMAGEAKSITEALLLISTIVAWDYFLDFLGSKSRFVSGILEPKELLLIENGKLLRRNMQKEMITYDELLSQLRQQGLEKVSDVKSCYLEPDGHFSIIKRNESNRGHEDNRKKKIPVS